MTTLKRALRKAERDRSTWCWGSFYLALVIVFVLTGDIASSLLASALSVVFAWHVGTEKVERIKKLQELGDGN